MQILKKLENNVKDTIIKLQDKKLERTISKKIDSQFEHERKNLALVIS